MQSYGVPGDSLVQDEVTDSRRNASGASRFASCDEGMAMAAARGRSEMRYVSCILSTRMKYQVCVLIQKVRKVKCLMAV